MRSSTIFLTAAAAFILFSVPALAQQNTYNKLTIILIRHGEKDPVENEETPDPRLSPEGEARAQRLIDILEKYKPDAVFSSQFKRTRATVMPFARSKNMMIQIYDHRNLNEIAEIATRGNFKRIVIVGHNSTTPALTNLLIGQEKYPKLDESVYDKVFIVRLYRKSGKPLRVRDEKMISY